MYQVGVLGAPSRRRFQIISELEMQHGFRVHTFTLLRDFLGSSAWGVLSALITIGSELTDTDIQQLDELSQSFPELKIIHLVHNVSEDRRNELKRYRLKNVTVLDVYYEKKDLGPIAKKMISGRPVVTRSHCRHPVNCRGYLYLEGVTRHLEIRVIDLSRGGLQAKIMSGKIPSGKPVKLHISKSDGKSYHQIDAHVAWTSQNGTQLGVEFDSVSEQTITHFSSSA